ncbi:MAG TPA: serine hydrolase [Trueperaceae bacterium]|nr:serine hydrolase [Trueperaceae bacterium]
MEPREDTKPRDRGLEPLSPTWPAKIAALESRLGGEGRPRPFPPAWQAPNDGGSPRIGVAAAYLATGGYRRAEAEAVPGASGTVDTRLEHRAAERFPAASTLKVFVLQALLEAVAAGRHGLDEQRALREAEGVTGSGVLKLLTPGTKLSLLDLATLMITVSDNTATNMLIDALGMEAIMASVTANGWSDTHLRGKLQQTPVAAGSKSSPTMTSPRDLADYFSRLWLGEFLPAELTSVAKGIYRRQQFTELGRSLDYDSYSAEIGDSDMLVASKSGSIRGVRNDAGVIELNATGTATAATAREPRRYVVAIMTDGCPDRRFHADNLGAVVVGEVAAAVLGELAG